MSSDAPTSHASATSYQQISSVPPPRPRFFPAPRSSSLQQSMGQSHSQGENPLSSLTLPIASALAAPISSSPSTQRLKFAWPGRRKKTEDASKAVAPPKQIAVAEGKGKERSVSSESPRGSFSALEHTISRDSRELSRTHSRQTSSADHQLLSQQSVTTPQKTSEDTVAQMSPAVTPPPLPPKAMASSSSDSHYTHTLVTQSVPRSSLSSEQSCAQQPSLPVGSARESSVPSNTWSMIEGEEISGLTNQNDSTLRRREKRQEDSTVKESNEDWRKSDSTLRTVRLVGNRTPRPLSLAESTNSGNTVSPSANASSPPSRRLSTLMTDADFVMPEVESEDEYLAESAPVSAFASSQDVTQVAPDERIKLYHARHHSATPPPKKNTDRRGSLSLRIGRFSPKSWSDHGHLSSDSEALSSSSTHDIRTANSSMSSVISSPRTSESATDPPSDYSLKPPPMHVGIVTSSSSSEAHYDSSMGHGDQVHLDPWMTGHKASESSTSLSTSNSSHSTNKDLPPMPASAVGSRPPSRSRLVSIHSRGFRQTAVSLTSGLGTSAVKGIGRKAVDKLGKALSGSSTNLAQGHEVPPPPTSASSNRTSSAHSIFTSHLKIGRSSSNQPFSGQSGSDMRNQPHHRNPLKRARTPNAPSGSWSVKSSSTGRDTMASLSDSDAFPSMASGPYLGKLVRPPRRPGVGGLVFGRDLAVCVRETAVDVGTFMPVIEGKEMKTSAFIMDMEVVGARALENRKLPALVTRCAQHIEKWGIQEEGLFRVSGRPSHVGRLRAEFDSGADYDMTDCGPGEIDPHAVAAVFKAYLRELPEPILTRNLIPYFEAALSAENSLIQSSESTTSISERPRVVGLPPRPKAGGIQIRRAPSLSTFAVPTLTPRAPSESLLNALASLIARLPTENRDLLRTVTELIKITSKRSKETKMPLSNLLLVFCPSLAMSPPLLRVLCEGEGIWDGPPKGTPDPIVVDIKREGDSETSSFSVNDSEDDSAEDGDIEIELRPRRTIRRAPRGVSPSSATGPSEVEEKVKSPATYPGNQFEKSAINASTAPKDINPHTPTESMGSVRDSERTVDSGGNSILHSPPPLTTSSESPISSEDSVGHFNAGRDASVSQVHEQTTVRSQSDLPSPSQLAVNKGVIGHTVPFPASDSAPVTPLETQPKLRLSTHSSSPNLSPIQNSNSSASNSPRRNKPSLQKLFPKRSLSSLLSRSPMTPDSPKSFATAPMARTVSDSPPVLELPIDSSPLKLGLGLGLEDAAPPAEYSTISTAIPASSSTANDGMRLLIPDVGDKCVRSASSNSSFNSPSTFYTPPTIHQPLAAASSQSSGSTSSYSLLEFSFGESQAETDGWASSVLKATTEP